MFYNRVKELAFLEEKWRENNANLIVTYGRRRLGKTELIKQFIQEKRAVYLFVNDIEEKALLDSFSTEIQRQLKATYAINSVSSFFDALVDLSKQKIVIVIDEFQRFKTNAPRFITELQNRWDSELKREKAMLILVGSSIGMMRRIAFSPSGALFKRKTGGLQIHSFPFVEFRKVFSDYSEEQKISLYSVFGGTPDYFTKIKSANIEKEIARLILEKNAPLYAEPQELLETESKRSARFNTILKTIASGKVTLKEISDQTNVKQSSLTPYLRDLSQLLDTIQTDEPLFGKQKTSRYQFKDPFFAFWYKFVFPNQSILEIQNIQEVSAQIEKELPAFEGHIVEQIVHELVLLKNNQKIGKINLNITAIGHWWDRRGTAEIDLVAHNKNGVLLGEILYQNKPMEYDELADLVERKQKLLIQTGKTPTGKIDYLFFSKKGFSKQAQKYAEQISAELIDLERLSRLFDNKE